MPVVVLANPKGGSGKTTAALLLATELATRGASVAVVDADPEQWISQWGRLPGRPANLTIHSGAKEETIIDMIEVAERDAQFVIVDLEGTASKVAPLAIGMSDFVIIPIQGSNMDAKGGAKTIKLIQGQEKVARRKIAHAVVLTRTSAAVTSRAQRNVSDQLANAGIGVLTTTIVERAAFRDIFDFGGTLADLDPAQVSNLDKARQNAREFVGEVVGRLKEANGKVAA